VLPLALLGCLLRALGCAIDFNKMVDGRSSGQRCFLFVFLLGFGILLSEVSVTLQLSTRWAAVLYSKGVLVFFLYCSLLPALAALFVWYKRCHRASVSDNKLMVGCIALVAVCVGVVFPVVAMLRSSNIVGGTYMEIVVKDYNMRSSICFFTSVINEYTSVITVLLKTGL
jgi:hypothetical protein